MHNIHFIRDQPLEFDQALKRRGMEPCAQAVLAMDAEYRQVLTQLQALQSRRNELAQTIGRAAKDKGPTLETLRVEAGQLKEETTRLESHTSTLKKQLQDWLASLPNVLLPDVPDGLDEAENIMVRQVGTPTSFSFDAKPHYELGEALGQMDFDQAAYVSGSRFVYLKGDLAKLERALGQFMVDVHTSDFGYELVSPPLLVNDQSMFGTDKLPKFHKESFQTTDGRWLIPTSEVSLTCYVADQILDEKRLPLRMTAHTPCFRSESGAAGKDTRGMLRQHQFWKVELVSITTPEASLQEHERMVGAAEEILKQLELPYRVMVLCGGDTGFGAQKTYDLEAWMPGQKAYREISSCSVCGDFQARRMNARFKRGMDKPEFVHTLNGSGLAVGRTLIAVMENYQQNDGSIQIPKVLVPYMKGQTFIHTPH